MKIVALLFVAAAAGVVVLAAPAPQDVEQQQQEEVVQEEVQEVVVLVEEEKLRQPEILLDERVQPHNGIYSFQVETENGIIHTEEGVVGSKGQTNVQGAYSFILDGGEVVEVRYTADEFGFQPKSSLLPVAPEFPHPIPQFVLDQIAFGEEQRRLKALRLQELEQQERLEQQQTVQLQVQEEVQDVVQQQEETQLKAEQQVEQQEVAPE
ncbi:cuticle protein AMP5-like [Homarus americanus]|uniref:cuticle protein AMP5-like n=1 Tax=Homarus americanus TaxID=6706 RepID=UPI001C45BD87|nr:cuticle protein AMP5-like [Homarus americanus]